MLVKYPRAANVAGKPLLTTLFYCCMYHWESGESHPGSPMALRKAHDLTTRQLLWTVMRGRARVHHWPLPQELDAWRDNKVSLIGGGYYNCQLTSHLQSGADCVDFRVHRCLIGDSVYPVYQCHHG